MPKRSLRSWLWSVPLEQEVDEELAFHREMREREKDRSGRPGGRPLPTAVRDQSVEADLQVGLNDRGGLRRTLIGIGRKRDREMRMTQWLEEIWTDIRFALRQMRRAPGYTAVAGLTLALGIGANSAMFALADGVLIRPLPFPNAGQLVTIEEWGPEQAGRSRIEWLSVREWQRNSRTFATMAAAWVPAEGGGRPMKGRDGTVEGVSFQTVTPEFFDVLGVPSILGRTFARTDDDPDPRALVLSEGFWRRRFGADPTVIGESITLDDRQYEVIGVVPDSAEFMRRSSIWTLLPMPRDGVSDATRGQCGTCRLLMAIGRLKPGVSVSAAQDEIAALANATAQQSGAPRPRRVVIRPYRDVIIGRDLRFTAMLFLGVVGLVLLMCCANVANLVLARTHARRREFAVRGAIGAGRRRLATQILTESLVLAMIGSAIGVAIAAATLSLAPAFLPAGLLPDLVPLKVDLRVLSFSLAAAVGVTLLFGIAPVCHTTRASLVDALAADGRTVAGHGNRFRNTVVAAQVAAAVVVLCGAGILLRTLIVLDGFAPGHRADREDIVTAGVTLPALAPGLRYPTADAVQHFYDTVQEDVEAIAGVHSAAWATSLPLGGSDIGRQAFEVVGRPLAPGEPHPQADYQIVSDSYFRTIDLPIVTGRAFTAHDDAGGVPVAIVNEAFVRRFLTGIAPIGARITVNWTGRPTVREIVGVVRQIKGRPEETEEFVQLYVPARQVPWMETNLIVRRDSGEWTTLLPAIRRAVAQADPRLALREFVTFDELASRATSRPRFRATLVGTFAGLALVLAMSGVFGVLAYSVQQRGREFGVRMALGATSRQILGLVLSAGARVIGTGMAFGILGALLLSTALSAFVFGVDPRDPATLVAVAIIMLVTAAAAALLPAWRASRTDPAVVFRD